MRGPVGTLRQGDTRAKAPTQEWLAILGEQSEGQCGWGTVAWEGHRKEEGYVRGRVR